MQGARVWSLVGELRRCTLCSAIKKEKIRCEWGQGLGIKYGFLTRQWRTNIRNWLGLTRIQSIRPSHKKKMKQDFSDGVVDQNPPPVQETRVRSLVQEDSMCLGATKPIRQNYWACDLEPESHNYWSPCAHSLCSQGDKPLQWEPEHRNEDPAQPNIKSEIRPLVATQMDPEVIVLREVRQTDIMIPLICGI